MYDKGTGVQQLLSLAQGVQSLFKGYGDLLPNLTIGMELQPDELRIDYYNEVRVTVKDINDIPYIFVDRLKWLLRDHRQNGTYSIQAVSADPDYYDDDWGDLLEEWTIEVGHNDGKQTVSYSLTETERTHMGTSSWPLYLTLMVTDSGVRLDNEGGVESLQQLSHYKGVLKDVNVLLKACDREEIGYQPVELPKTDDMVGVLSKDIEYIKGTLNDPSQNKIGQLYQRGTHELYRELELFFGLGDKVAYLSYNAIGYNYNWNVATSLGYAPVKTTTQYTLNDLSWQGLSQKGWQSGDLSGRCVRSLRSNDETYSTIQSLLAHYLGDLFDDNEWYYNKGSGSGVRFALDTLVDKPITKMERSFEKTLYFTEDNQLVARIQGYKKINEEGSMGKLDELRKALGLI